MLTHFSYGEFNMGYTAHFVRPKNCFAIPSHIPNIKEFTKERQGEGGKK